MSTFSIDGLISGLNTTEVINKLLEIERAPIQKLEARKSEANLRLSAWRTLNTKLTTLEERAGALALSSTYQAAKATTSDPKVAVASAAVGAVPGTYTLTVNHLVSTHQLSTDTYADKDAQVFGTGTVTITVNGVSTDVAIADGQNSLSGIAAALNASGAGVYAAVMQVDGGYRLVLTSRTSGAAGAISVDTSGLVGGSEVLSFPHELSPAQDAEVVLGSGAGAVVVHRPSNVVTDLLPGVTLALAATGTVTVTVEQDLEAVKKAVRDFVAAYNDVADSLAQYGRYNPETKQRGALQGDGTLQRIQAELPDAVLRTEVTGQALKRLSDLGVRMGRDGKLTLDESKLADALQGRLSEARRVLEAAGGRLRDVADNLTKVNGPVWLAIDALNSRIRGYDQQITRWEDRVERKREQLVRMFTELEKALGQLRSQGDWLAQQIRNLGGSNR
ncbi:MAG: flagellar filament capping protein FliD [Armatimonadota bacterium]|nr:flagellar filament capping protein FliD [Armatimonadota bacterium]MDR7569523.1 flagellar filament capping protein FliD [Armatimonadota bacterium]MDR7613555.1 flagellar filament capping protein FliD [Armatimonadota bacterium]